MVDLPRTIYSCNGPGPDELVTSEAFKEFLDCIPGGLFRYPLEEAHILDYYNKDLLEMYGCENFEQWLELTGNVHEGMIHPDDLADVEAKIIEDAKLSDRVRTRHRIIRYDGEIRWVEGLGTLVESSDGKLWVYVTLVDITEQMQYLHEIEESYERLEIITALSNDVIFDMDCSNDTIEVFGNFQKRFGREPETSDFVFMRRQEDRSRINPERVDSQILEHNLPNGELQDFEISLPGADGQPIWCRYQSFIQTDADGNDIRRIGRLLDTHEMTLRKAEFQHLAEHDSLTNLLNRAAANKRIEAALDDSDTPATFIIIDIDDFKHVNDGFGHPEGDRILKELASHLRRVCRSDDVVARFGGDEFVVFAKGLGEGDALQNLVNRLLSVSFNALRNELMDGTYEIMLPTISLGVATSKTCAVSPDELYEIADEVLYKAKEQGKNQASFVSVE